MLEIITDFSARLYGEWQPEAPGICWRPCRRRWLARFHGARALEEVPPGGTEAHARAGIPVSAASRAIPSWPTTGRWTSSGLAWRRGNGSPRGPCDRDGIWSRSMITPWSRELSQNAAKYAIIDVGQAISNWREYGRKRKQGISCRRIGFPRFKRRKHEEGFQADNGPDTVRVDGKGATLPKIGTVALVEHLRFTGPDLRGHRQPYRRPMVCQLLHRHRRTPASAQGRTHHGGRRRHRETGRLLRGNRGGDSQGTGTSPETTEEAG